MFCYLATFRVNRVLFTRVEETILSDTIKAPVPPDLPLRASKATLKSINSRAASRRCTTLRHCNGPRGCFSDKIGDRRYLAKHLLERLHVQGGVVVLRAYGLHHLSEFFVFGLLSLVTRSFEGNQPLLDHRARARLRNRPLERGYRFARLPRLTSQKRRPL